ncbi:hypothetical protein HIM_00723 [Hirsutella minnesotensis 3608]|nr:hypothetical protein HIM_00723 [Hirsutella minnesotensis 3608]
MPPLVPRKRLRDSTSPAPRKKRGERQTPASGKRKATLYDDLDAAATPLSSKQSASIAAGFDQDDNESSLTSLSDGDFEDVPPAKRPRAQESDDDDDDDDDDVEFEDVVAPVMSPTDAPVVSGDLELTLRKDTRISLINMFGDKKGPSKRERMVRNSTHCVHVLFLLWHNAVRNSWLCDAELQAIMVSHIPPKIWDEVDRWRRSSGLEDAPAPSKSQTKSKGKPGSRSSRRSQKMDKAQESEDAGRDWGAAAKRLEHGAVDLSHGDPLFRLMQSLVAWWKQRFRITAPGLRKSGYMALERLDRLTKAYDAGVQDASKFGDRIADLETLRCCAQACQGSRDVGAQLFTALLRCLGLEARMVANLPCLGFGWNKLEDAEAEKEDDKSINAAKKEEPAQGATKKTSKSKGAKANGSEPPKSSRKTRSTGQAKRRSENVDDLRLEYSDTDDESVVEVQITPKRTAQKVVKYDTDLEFPHYWTEVLSPVTKRYLPVDAIVKGTIATNRGLVEAFEPRGAKADKARQIMAYIVGYSQDGTAKDVTVRYLKRQVLPGRTKGARMPLEKVPIYNRHGRVKRHEHFDWFKSAMSGYRRGGKKCPLTEVDHDEDATDLKPAKPEKKEVKEGEETLQYYKQSKEFALERHLKREEALKPGAAPVKVFNNKVKGGKVEEEDVYLRTDVVNVKSAETWHKQGRAPIPGEQPLKRVPYRAATLNRRREILEAEAATGEKVLQGLYSFDQTDWIIPPPIENGVIPKNSYGNIDLFAEHMCPKGAVHVPFRGAAKVCKRLQIDYAEAVIDFEFGNRMAVPVIQGVVVAEEHHDRVMVEIEKDEAERARKEDEKRRKAALGKWRKFMMGLRIVERIRQDYGDIDENATVFGHSQDKPDRHVASKGEDEDMAGGFLPEGYEEEDEKEVQQHQVSSFFPVGDDGSDDDGDDGLIMEDDRQGPTATEAPQDESADEPAEPVKEPGSRNTTQGGDTKKKAGGAKAKARPRPAARRSTRARRTVASSDDDDEGDDDGDWGDSDEDVDD